MQVQINGQQIVSLPNYTFSYIAVKPGEVKIKISWSKWSGMLSREQPVDILPHQTLYIELGSSVGTPYGGFIGDSSNRVRDSEKAIEQLLVCCKYVPTNAIEQSHQKIGQ